MSAMFEEIDSQASPLGEISLRRRRIPALGERDIYEVKLGDEFLMSSMFVRAEEALSELGLAAVEGENLQVVVGGLGLGHTADAALKEARVSELLIVEALEPVISWHRDGKVPLGKILNDDERCQFVHGSFFDLAVSDSKGFSGIEQAGSEKKIFDAILLDIDHSPSAFLNSENASFYSQENLSKMAEQLREQGVFAMWSNELEDKEFTALLNSVFEIVECHVVAFYNPFQNCESANTVYVAKK